MAPGRAAHTCDAGRDPAGPRQSRPRSRLVRVAGITLAVSACAPTLLLGPPGGGEPARFATGRDTFAFANLVRAERPGLNDGFANYCIIMTRAASQFFRFARFAPEAPAATPEAYTRLTRQVLAIDPWAPPPVEVARVVVPGYSDLHAFSRAQEPAIKAAFGSSVWSMVHWRTWRVGVPLSAAHQRQVARELMAEVVAGRPASLMLTNFPHPDLLNHAVLVYDYRIEARTVEFLAYDPNDPGTPLGLRYEPATQAFWVAALPYSPPGRIRAFRLFASPSL